jgi:ankyrin repeat protein
VFLKRKVIKIILAAAVFAVLVTGCPAGRRETADDPALDEALVEAVRNDNLRLAKRLIRKGADPDSKLDNLTTVLHLAIYRSNPDMVELLVDSGADMTLFDSERNVPLTLAAREGSCEIAAYFIEQGADVNYINNNRFKSTALMEAAYVNALDVVKLLVENGADINALGLGGYPAIMWAADSGGYESVVYLVEQGADPSFIRKPGKMNALDFAIRGGYPELEEYLRSLGVEPASAAD